MNYYDEIKKELLNNEVTKKAKDYSKNKGDLTAYYNVGKLLNPKGEKVTTTEDIDFPKSLAFLRDSTVSIAITMMTIYVIVAIAAGILHGFRHCTTGSCCSFCFLSSTSIIPRSITSSIESLNPGHCK